MARLGMNEGTKGGRWRAVARRKKDRKEKVGVSSVSMGASVNKRRRGARTERNGSNSTKSIPLGRVWVLGGNVCRVAWPIVCKGSRSSSKEPAEEEEEGSEAN